MNKSKFKIVGFLQVYNEIEKGNLKRFFKYFFPLIDDIVIYDDGSTDGSYEYCLNFTKNIIKGNKNEFENEILHKDKLLKIVLKLKPDFILWLNADEVISARNRSQIDEACNHIIKNNLDGLSFKQIHLWRSLTWKRIDSLYDTGWFVRVWRSRRDLSFPSQTGLHQKQYPKQIKKIEKYKKLSVLHFGFSKEKNIAEKYIRYKGLGQRGYIMLDRLLSEKKLNLRKVDKSLFPNGLYKSDEARPKKLKIEESFRLVEKYMERFLKDKAVTDTDLNIYYYLPQASILKQILLEIPHAFEIDKNQIKKIKDKNTLFIVDAARYLIKQRGTFVGFISNKDLQFVDLTNIDTNLKRTLINITDSESVQMKYKDYSFITIKNKNKEKVLLIANFALDLIKKGFNKKIIKGSMEKKSISSFNPVIFLKRTKHFVYSIMGQV